MNHWQRLSQQFGQMSSREQWMIAGAGWIAILYVGFLWFIEPETIALQQAKTSLVDTRNNIVDINNQIIIMQRKLKADPNVELEKKITDYEQKVDKLEQLVKTKVSSLMTPSEMPMLLEEVLQHSKKLKLEEMTTLASSVTVTSNNEPAFYTHPLRLKLSGSYFDVLEYLTQLEALPVKYYWRSLDYQVKEYPKAQVVLEVYTLGETKDFIGG